jgi:alkylated DNA repair dioxygenase AlkB
VHQVRDRPDHEYVASWIESERADALVHSLVADTPWEQRDITMFGRRLKEPRLTAWYGDPGARYTYSRIVHEPLAWTPTLTELRRQLETTTTASFNSVLLNLYRDGRDSNGWHSDDEPELGPEPVIASLSLGVTRTMRFRRRDGTAHFELALHHGDLLVMRGDAQSAWRHTIAKSARVHEPRVNLTFRQIN